MPDVRNDKYWDKKIKEFRDFAKEQDAEFEHRILSTNKEVLIVKQFYHAQKNK